MDFLLQNFDTIVKIVVISFGAFSFFLALKNQISLLRVDVNHIKENQKQLSDGFAQLGSILTKVAVQDARLQMLEKKLDELSHGQGFVK